MTCVPRKKATRLVVDVVFTGMCKLPPGYRRGGPVLDRHSFSTSATRFSCLVDFAAAGCRLLLLLIWFLCVSSLLINQYFSENSIGHFKVKVGMKTSVLCMTMNTRFRVKDCT